MCKSNNDSSLEKCYDFKSDTINPDKFSKGNHNNYNNLYTNFLKYLNFHYNLK